MARGAARRRRGGVRGHAARSPGGRPPDRCGHLRALIPSSALRRPHPRDHAADLFAGRPRSLPREFARLEAPHARLERGDPDRRRARDRPHRADGGRGRRGSGVPGRDLLVRRPRRFHRRPARRDPAPHDPAGPGAAVQGPTRGDGARRHASAPCTRRRAPHARGLDPRPCDARRRPVRRGRLAGARARRLRRTAGPGGGACSSTSRPSRPRRWAPSSGGSWCR